LSRNFINQSAPPALPLARDEYDRAYQDQLSNVLRIYFVQLNAALNLLQAPPVYLVADLPSPVDVGVGAKSFVTNASGPTFGSIVVGGGAVKVPVYSDGTNWRVG
jgi:hypothetical protein